jgi:uncharacterized protein GlcG (DUF336 family)
VAARNIGSEETMSVRKLIFMAALALAVSGAGIEGAGAQGLTTTHRVSAALANEAVGAAVAACAAKGYAVTAVLVDLDGVRQAMLRADRAGIHTVGAAEDKAYTAISLKSDTSAVEARFKTNPAPSVLVKTPRLVLSAGGIVLKIGDEPIGAIGVSGAPGGEKDEACGHAGFDAIKDRLK